MISIGTDGACMRVQRDALNDKQHAVSADRRQASIARYAVGAMREIRSDHATVIDRNRRTR